ncbi:hypothetical protein SSP531S_05970 [Streptomyces spongiicola]|uniref:Transcription regulator AsnC/Lrp ligand binding domain-containing protein n=1 Tax=Streptomyces spongiicola TaxID=1690221 RepID=A0A388SRE1_9ACTN|nr:hypothetical protein SSP531S_05970 [Streptomyces spongiicola]
MIGGDSPSGIAAKDAGREKILKESLAFVRLRHPHGGCKPFHDLLGTTPEILEAHRVTGDDCSVLKVAARSMSHL